MKKLTLVPKNFDTLMDSRSLRDRYADKVEALERAGKLTMLPDDLHVTVDMAANFYQVPSKTVHTVIQRHKDELKLDGMKVIGGSDFANFKVRNANSLSLSPKARSMTVITRQALLRIGMVLRDSEVAKALRTYLVKLDAVAKKKAPRLINDSLMEAIEAYSLPIDYKGALIQLLKENGQLKNQLESANGEIKTLKPKAQKYDDFLNSKGHLYIGDIAKVLGIPNMGPNKLFDFLRFYGVLCWNSQKRNVPTQNFMDKDYFRIVYFETLKVNETGELERISTPTTYVTPKGIDFIRDLLVECGYRPKMTDISDSSLSLSHQNKSLKEVGNNPALVVSA